MMILPETTRARIAEFVRTNIDDANVMLGYIRGAAADPNDAYGEAVALQVIAEINRIKAERKQA